MEQNNSTNIPTIEKINPGIKPSQNSKSNKYLIATIICAILAICGIVFAICTLISSNHKSAAISDLSDQVAAKDAEIAALKSENSAGSSAAQYGIFADNLAQNYNGTVFGYYYHYTGTENVRRTVAADVKDHHLTITDIENDNQIIAEADDIISVYYIEVGNGGAPYFYMINKDGKVSRLSLLESGPTKTIETLDDYSNIVSVIQGGDLYAWLIDIDGNVHKSE